MAAQLGALALKPKYVAKVWGGNTLLPGPEPIGESWVVYEKNEIVGGHYAGQTLEAVARKEGVRLLGTAIQGDRFPLLIKLIDASESLSVQVHPDDALAEKLEGPGNLGKTEAWHILDARDGAELVSGVEAGVTREAWAAAMGSAKVKELLRRIPVKAGDTLFIPAGTVHAIGAGLFLYEVQQTSDTTYRVYDWDRPMKPGRELHVSQSIECSNLKLRSDAVPPPAGGNGILTQCEYFKLEMLSGSEGEGAHVTLETRGESFHALTCIEGRARVRGNGWSEEIGRFETVVVPACEPTYSVEAVGSYRLLKSSVV